MNNFTATMWFMTLDIASGFLAVPMTARAQLISAFICPLGHFQWKRMQFGPMDAPLIYQQLLDNCLWGFVRLPAEVLEFLGISPDDSNRVAPEQMGPMLSWSSNIDDIIYGASSWDDLCKTLNALLCRLRYWNISLGRNPDVPKTGGKFLNLPFTKIQKEVQSFLGSLNYYAQFIEDLLVLAAALYEASDEQLRSGRDLEKAKYAFKILKDRLVSTPLLQHPDPWEAAHNLGLAPLVSFLRGETEQLSLRYTTHLAKIADQFVLDSRDALFYDLQEAILHHWHADLQGARQGIIRTYERLRKEFYWIGMFKDTGDTSNVRFSGFIMCKAMASTEAQYGVEAFDECVFRRFRVSEMIRHDQDPRFMGPVFKHFREMLGSRQRATLAYRPQANGQQERSVQTVIRSVKVEAMSIPEDDDFYAALLPDVKEYQVKRKGCEAPDWVPQGRLNCGRLLYEFDQGERARVRFQAMQSGDELPVEEIR
ncbi:reverse transcriptase [Phytophthora megakarya]|uniref:Reverse transcriptase n=1 Tax=Phytophthora megakarya TaxID=4795 RepID=A0A225VY41_9STRA|nr:reverse transcriptase [Phytophthora megakarya]